MLELVYRLLIKMLQGDSIARMDAACSALALWYYFANCFAQYLTLFLVERWHSFPFSLECLVAHSQRPRRIIYRECVDVMHSSWPRGYPTQSNYVAHHRPVGLTVFAAHTLHAKILVLVEFH